MRCYPPLCPQCPSCPKPSGELTVIYNPNGGIGGTADYNLAFGFVYTVKTQQAAAVFRLDFNFTGWNTLEDGSGTTYQPGDVIIITCDITLYAQWEAEPADTFSVTYLPNGGTNVFTDSDLPGGSSYSIKDNNTVGITRDGFIFNGWNTQADGSGTDYPPGNNITITSDIILYAQWTPEPIGTYTVTYHRNPPTGSDDTYTVPRIPLDIAHTVYSNVALGFYVAGYAFLFWNTAPNGTGMNVYADQAVIFNTDLDLYAIWMRFG